MFVGRNSELERLQKQFAKKKSIILLYGRRRIGKTSLLRQALKNATDAKIIYHEFHRVTLSQNLAEFSSSIGQAFSIPSLPSFGTLVDAFNFIALSKERTIVVMDEYSDLKFHAQKGEIDSYMRSVVDSLPDNIVLVLSGSLLKAMEELLKEENPMFGRFTHVMKLSPLNYVDASLFFPGKNCRAKMEIYSVFGGSPYVLSLLDENLSIEENIEETLIPLSGSVRAYIEAVINMEAGRIPHAITILALIGNGKKKYRELENVIGKDASGVLDRELKMLIDLDLVSKVHPINRNDRAKTFYEITDPLLRFYFMFIYPNPELMTASPSSFYENYIAKGLKDFMARRFEEACRQYFRLLVEKGIRKDILDIGTYWYDDRENRRNGEFDVALKTTGGFEIYDAKFVSSPISACQSEKERTQLAALPIPLAKWGIVSSAGFEVKDESYIQLTLDDMYQLS